MMIDEDRIIETLSSRDVAPDTIANASTYLCTLFVLDPVEPLLRVSIGSPDRAPMETFRFERKLAATR